MKRVLELEAKVDRLERQIAELEAARAASKTALVAVRRDVVLYNKR